MHFGLAAFIEIWVYSTLFTLYSYNVNIIWSIHFTFLSLIWNWYKSLLILQRKNKTIFLFVCSQSVRFEKRNASHGSVRIIVSLVSSTVGCHQFQMTTTQTFWSYTISIMVLLTILDCICLKIWRRSSEAGAYKTEMGIVY